MAKLKDVCARCGKRYGDHALVGSWCPAKERGMLFGTTRFRKVRSSSTKGNK